MTNVCVHQVPQDFFSHSPFYLTHSQANNCHAEALEFIESKKETLPHLEAELKTWEKKAKAFASIDDLKTKVGNLKNELVWTLVTQVCAGCGNRASRLSVLIIQD